MAKFEQVNRDVNNVIISLLSNQTLCKLLLYVSDSPLSEPDILDTSILINEHNKCISPYPRILGTVDEKAAYINVYLNRFRLDGGNKGTKECLLTFEILVHNDKWLLPSQELIRPLLIMSEIDKMVNNQKIAGIKGVSFNAGDILVPNVSFSGYRITYNIVSVN